MTVHPAASLAPPLAPRLTRGLELEPPGAGLAPEPLGVVHRGGAAVGLGGGGGGLRAADGLGVRVRAP